MSLLISDDILWISWSDCLLATFTPTAEALTELQTLRGWFFVSCTSLLLYGLIWRRVRQLQQKHQLLQNIINSISDAIFVKDLQGRYVVVNKMAAQSLGHPTMDILGKVVEQFLSPEEAQRIRSLEQTILQTGQSEEVEELLTINGEARWFSTTKSLCLDERSRPVGIVGIARDITERKQAEAERRRSEQLRIELKLLENILEIILAGYWDWDILGKRLYYSLAWKRMLGYDDHELPDIPETWQQLIFAEDLPRIMDCFDQHIQSRGQIPLSNEVRYQHKNGSTIWVICSGRVIEWDENGNPLRIMGCHIDITQRKQVEEALRENERRFKAVFNQQFQFMAILKPDGTVIDVNDTCLRVTGVSAERVLGVRFWETPWFNQIPLMQERLQQSIAEVVSGSGSVRGEVEYSMADGTTQFATYAITGLKDDRDQVVEIIVEGEGVDFTQRKQAEEQLRQTNEQLAHVNAKLARATRLKDEFLANMSHELRTPLTSILGMSDMLRQEIYGSLNEKQHQYLEVISQSGNHLLTLINDILDLAKIESGKMELQILPTSIEALCNSSLNFIKQVAYQKAIKLETRIPTNIGQIDADELRMRQALINLLSNAIKFTPEKGQVVLEVSREFSTDRLHQHTQQLIQFSVIDTGIGIAPEHLPKLFQSFVQIDSSLNRKYSGTGLGLALVKQIAELHQGTVSVVSTVGQGSRFTITLPSQNCSDFTQMQAMQLERTLPSEQPLQLQDSTVTGLLPAQPLILLAEDNPANIDTFSAYLTSCGFRLIVATNGQEAINLAQQQPDLILMDIQMPGMDGLEAIRQIRADCTLTNVPIIAVTALAMAGDRDKCLAAGATEYLAKPVSLKQLKTMIQQLLTMSKPAQ
ncbi:MULTISPECIES: PAS domain-containing hybrid sensor histidine kinase/response regulator [unclassified Nostoc]|uniref:PAS domain-containing hybrid sensor histidine kinase/response regulator n=1 Tax=unclassified Nostoc TaxID=2593658 RepID=UPI001DD93B50|nr:PAS domain-containing hybrid sensor histidine kinase/response regulator [Nostoc sp. JL23]MBN3880146.1 PAS domain S-box protein [Nostoc sp. JL23]